MLGLDDRISRISETTHVVRIDDSVIYRIKDWKILDQNVIFVETETDLWFQDLDVLTLEEAANAERMLDKVRDIIT